MLGFFDKLRAFILAAVLHVLIGFLLFAGFQHSTPILKPVARQQVEIIKGVVVDESALQQQVDKLRKIEEDKRQAEVDRKNKLEEEIKKAEQQKRKAEEAKKKAEQEAKKLVEQKAADEKRLAEIALKRKAEEAAKRKAEAEKKKAEQEAKKLVEQRVAEEKRLAELAVQRKAEEAAKQKAEQEKRKVEEARKKAEEEATRKKVAEEKRQAEEARKKAAAEAKRKADEVARKQREADDQRLLNELLESEGQGLESENQSQLQVLQQRYVNDIRQKVQSSWLRPSNYQSGWKCVVIVRQGPGGTVLSADAVASECDGDEQFRRSVENAVYRAEPLPAPEDPSLFAKELRLEFKPKN